MTFEAPKHLPKMLVMLLFCFPSNEKIAHVHEDEWQAGRPHMMESVKCWKVCAVFLKPNRELEIEISQMR